MIRLQILLLMALLLNCSQRLDNEVKDEQAIRELFSKTTAVFGKSASGYVDARAENSIFVQQGGRVLVGKGEILKFYESVFQEYDFGTLDDFAPDKFPFDEILISGDLAFARVTYSSIFTPKATSRPDTISSRHFYLLQKREGQWKITHDMFTNVQYKQ